MKTVLLIILLIFSFFYAEFRAQKIPARLLTHVSKIMEERYTDWEFVDSIEFKAVTVNGFRITCYIKADKFNIKCMHENGWDAYINENWDKELTMELRSKDQ